MNNTDYVKVGDVCRSRLHQQCQYGSRYLDKTCGPDYPYLGEGLRILGDTRSYHDMEIHKDDVEVFVSRYKDYKEQSRL